MSPRLNDRAIIVGIHSNGAHEQAAVITRVWPHTPNFPGDPQKVNLIIFPDNALPTTRTSVPMYESLEKANEAKAMMPFCYLQSPT